MMTKMFKEKFENIKSLMVKKTEGGNKKNIENLVVFLIILIITIVVINIIWKDNGQEDGKSEYVDYKQLATLDENVNNINIEKPEDNLEQRLESILSNITGVRRC